MYQQSFTNQSGFSLSPYSLNSLVFYTQSDTEHFHVGQVLTGAYGKLYKLVKLQWITGNIYEITLLPYEEPQP